VSGSNEPIYPVGYKKPPQHTQFKPGQSGNPHGRPKKVATFEEALRTELLAAVTVVQKDGKRRRISKQTAMLRQLINEAATGNLRAAMWISKLALSLKSTERSALDELVQTMRNRHAQLEVASQKQTRRTRKSGPGRRQEVAGTTAAAGGPR
jgi:hypothetical protein